MAPVRLLAATLLALALALRDEPARARQYLIQIDKPSQTMTVSVDRRRALSLVRVERERPASRRQPCTYKPFRMEVMHYSQEWDNAGMPHSIFFTSRGTPCTAPTILASARRCRMVVFASR